jgi:uncharacterized protein
MELMSYINLSKEEVTTLHDVATQSIKQGLQNNKPLAVDEGGYGKNLQQVKATFVTLTKFGELRGCIGTLQASYSLVKDVAMHSFAAAFEDPRFPPVTEAELPNIKIEISILTDPEPFPVDSEQDLLAKIRPNVDGIILSEGYRKATFLPAVWEQLPDPQLFIQHLKQKAGFSADYWSEQMEVARYQAQKI